jgi:peptidyl-prolyl cis-trans isomerase A (cyclophilin A)
VAGYQFGDNSIPTWSSTTIPAGHANAGRHQRFRSSSSPSARSRINRRHTIFGEVADQASRDVVDEIANVQTGRAIVPSSQWSLSL